VRILSHQLVHFTGRAPDPSVTEMYLAHAERGMKRNYAERNWAALDQALVALEQVFRLAVQA